jgi:hypothetical protein
MNKTLILVILFFTFSVYSQDFEGEVDYKLSYYQRETKVLIESPEIIKLLTL